MDPLLNMYFHVTYPTFNASYDLARNCLSVLSSVTGTAHGFQLISPFLLSSTSQVWCRPCLAAYFGFFLIYERFHGH